MKNNTKPAASTTHQNCPLSKTSLWDRQKEFYLKEGISAWANKVPFYATSNPYIANSYANLIIEFIKDTWQKRNQEPFYIIELGAGSGAFSFYTLKRLQELQKIMSLTDIPIVYVMTDFAEDNIEFWQKHPTFNEFIEQGLLDFARYDIEHDRKIELLQSGNVLESSREPKKNPLIVLANYIFDTIPHDVFKITKGNPLEGITNSTPKIVENLPDNYSLGFSDIGCALSYRKMSFPYYEEDDLDTLLLQSAKEIDEGYLIFPIGGLRTIKKLQEISKGNLFLITSDKGFARHFNLFSKSEPEISFHNSAFSLMVNYHVMGKFFEDKGGDYFHQITQQAITTSAFVMGTDFSHLAATRHAVKAYLENFSPGDLYNVYSHIAKTKLDCSLETLISYLNMTHWDPQVFNWHFDIISALVQTTHMGVIHDLLQGLPKIAQNFYYIPNGIDTFANLGIVFQAMGQFEDAIENYHKSLHHFGDLDTVFYNLGLCHFFLKDYEKSREMFEAAIQKNPNYIMAKGWLSQVIEEQEKEKGSGKKSRVVQG